ncbi:hypothetical protein [Rhodohalobacter sp. 8-1]|uniref:hypothetical protein n=1 Tax=Rhodohalobacter sp. 8-1 TaxID=3131972 RepID=UPI0030EF1FAE
MDSEAKPSQGREGYIYTSYGKEKYLRSAFVSALTIRRYDKARPIALICSQEHADIIDSIGLKDVFDRIEILDEKHQSIVGFKHNLHHYMPFERNMYLDSDMIWCRHPDNLWHAFKPYGYTITGQDSADVFYGAPKNAKVFLDVLLRRRQRTVRKFGLSHLYRVQTGIMYAADKDLTRKVNDLAAHYLKQKEKTHFVSRTTEAGRSLESCEWSLGMAMSKLELFVYPWFNGYESPQLDYIHGMVEHDQDYIDVVVQYFCNPFIQALRGLKSKALRNFVLSFFSLLPRSMDHMWVTPYVLHFGWKHQKEHFFEFAEQQWSKHFQKDLDHTEQVGK